MKGETNYSRTGGFKQAIADKPKKLMWTVHWLNADRTYTPSEHYEETEHEAHIWAESVIRAGRKYIVLGVER